jgi:CDGSH-type Zn-finger protein/mannose-6-phosphate isomerase-like protein (cupin superfamily)
MSEASIGGRKPCLVKFGKTGDLALWCACGRSARQPYCDGSHKGTGMTPMRVLARHDNEEALLCACKRTKTPPYCDGSHNTIGDTYGGVNEAEFDWAAAIHVERSHGTHGRSDLDGGCFVLTPLPGAGELMAGWLVLPTINPSLGADKLSQYLLIPTTPVTENLSFGAAEVVLFMATGAAEIEISGRTFAAPTQSAITIRPGEAFLVRSSSLAHTKIVATVCPPECCVPGVHGRFVDAFPERARFASATEREPMGDRFFQVLTSEMTGAREVTQFIGGISRSRAAVHRHLYEETLLILSGEGVMWTETKKTAVGPGDVIYLPRKQLHSLECASPDGMVLAGSFYPAGSPAINY